MLLPRIRLLLVLVLGAVLATYAAVVVHDFYSYVDRSIFASVDDSEANIAYTVSTRGNYGFPASPVLVGLDRSHAQFNYGPWYFYLAGALTWVFGFSLTLIRSIHLWIVLGSIAAAAFWFRGRDGIAQSALYALGLLYCFEVSHWPMVRPDVMVSVFGVGLVIAAGAGVRRLSPWLWFGAGVAAACGAFTHLIAFSLLPSAGVLFVAAAVLEVLDSTDRLASRRVVLRAALGFTLGVLVGMTMFYSAIRFEFGIQWRFLNAYREFTASPVGPWTAIGFHWSYAYSYLSREMQYFVAATMAVGWVVSVAALWCAPATRRTVIAQVAPPTLIWTAYLVSNGFYTNYHQGYAILHQMLFLWLAVALAGLAMRFVRLRLPRTGEVLGCVLLLALSVQATSQLRWQLSGESWKSQRIATWVPFSEYAARVIDVIPLRARAWGTVIFGLESPDRLQLVQWADAASLFSSMSVADRAPLLPDYIIWGYPESRDNMMSVTRGSESLWARTSILIGAAPTRVVSLIGGAPYGVTRTYARRVGPLDPTRLVPEVSVYDPGRRQWLSRVAPSAGAVFTPIPPVTLNIGYEASPPASVPTRTVAADLPAGRYLLRVDVTTGPEPMTRRLLAAVSANMLRQTMGEAGPDGDFASYLVDDTHVFMLAIHPGGPLYVSQFDAGATAGIGGVTAFPIVGLLDPAEQPKQAIGLPALTLWAPVTGVTAQVEGDTIRVAGDDTLSGYQIISPLIRARSHNRITVRIPLKVEAGKVCMGVLNGSGSRWLVAPDVARGELQFPVDDTQGFRLVAANCNPAAGGGPTRFVLWPGDYLDEPTGTSYADLLVGAVFYKNAVKEAERAGPEVQTVPADLVVTKTAVDGPIEALSPDDLGYRAALLAYDNGVWTLNGKAEGAFMYALQSKPRRFERDQVALIKGRITQGGVTLGLQKDNQWVAQLNVTDPGDFTVAIAPPGRGTYTIVVAHNLPRGLDTSIVIDRLGVFRAGSNSQR